MMKKTIFIILFFISFSGIQAQSDAEGFRNWKWGLKYTEVSDRLKPSKNRLPRLKAFDKKSENFNFEGIKVHTISYGFRDELFAGVNIGIYNKDLDHILAVFKKKYGEPRKIDTPILVNYEWHLKSGDISISYFPSKKGSKNTSIGISKKREKSEGLFKKKNN